MSCQEIGTTNWKITYIHCSNIDSVKSHILNIFKDISVTKLRVSCHKLEIEFVRCKKVRADARLCPLCKLEVDDEIHFVTNEPPREKTNNLHMRKQRRRSASQ